MANEWDQGGWGISRLYQTLPRTRSLVVPTFLAFKNKVGKQEIWRREEPIQLYSLHPWQNLHYHPVLLPLPKYREPTHTYPSIHPQTTHKSSALPLDFSISSGV